MGTYAAMHLRALLDQRSLDLQKTLRTIASEAGISRSYLYKLTDGSIQNPSIKSLYRLAHAMKISPIALFRLYDEIHSTSKSPNDSNQSFSSPHAHNSLDSIAINPTPSTPQYSIVYGGEVFKKTWEIQNTGSIAWINRKLCRLDTPVEIKDSKHNVHQHLTTLEREINIPNTKPGEISKISVNLSAPKSNCTATSLCRIEDSNKSPCYEIGFLLSVVVTVLHR